MLDLSWGEFWWKNITGANMIVSKVADALYDNSLVILCVPDDLPWRYDMRSSIELEFRKAASFENVVVRTVDVADECPDQDPGRFLLERFCNSREIKMGYREGSSKTIQQYIISNGVLHDSINWVKGVNAEDATRWLRFCRNYKSKGVKEGIFLLEIKDYIQQSDFRNNAVIRFSDCVSEYDVQLLNSFILDSAQEHSNNWKKYISTLSACLCETDAEVSAEFLSSVDFTVEDPLDGLERINESGNYNSRGRDSASNHILALYREGNTKAINRRIWKAQTQVLFPIIEMERIKYIEKYYAEIETVLKNETIQQHDEVLTVPTDVELGTLCYLIWSGKMNMSSTSDRNRIKDLREYRNKIAHIGCLSPTEITALLDDSFLATC
jgi:hypothetical protein